MINITPVSRFHRIIKKLGRYVEATAVDLVTPYGDVLLDSEYLLGVYHGDFSHEDIFFTDQAFIFTECETGNIRRISYSMLGAIDFPIPASESIELVLHLLDSSNVKIKVVGRQGNFRDVFEVGRFFMRVAGDMRDEVINGNN